MEYGQVSPLTPLLCLKMSNIVDPSLSDKSKFKKCFISINQFIQISTIMKTRSQFGVFYLFMIDSVSLHVCSSVFLKAE